MMIVWRSVFLLLTMAARTVQAQVTATVPTDPPTESPDKCKGLAPGIVLIYVLNAVNPDQFALFPVGDIPEEVGSLYFTDNAWNGTGFVDIEGTIEYKLPPGGLKVAQGFQYGVESSEDEPPDLNAGEWVIVDDSPFALNPETGDTLLVYCKTEEGEPHFINGINFAGPWAEPGLDSYDISQSALPTEISEVGSVVLQGFGNWQWSGFGESTRDELIVAFSDKQYWQGSDIPFTLAPGSGGGSSSNSHQSVILCGISTLVSLAMLLSSFSRAL